MQQMEMQDAVALPARSGDIVIEGHSQARIEILAQRDRNDLSHALLQAGTLQHEFKQLIAAGQVLAARIDVDRQQLHHVAVGVVQPMHIVHGAAGKIRFVADTLAVDDAFDFAAQFQHELSLRKAFDASRQALPRRA